GVSAPQIFQNRSPNRGNHPAAKPRDRAIAVFTAQPTVTSCAISVPGLLYLVEQARAGLAEPADAETKRTLRCGQRCSPPPTGTHLPVPPRNRCPDSRLALNFWLELPMNLLNDLVVDRAGAQCPIELPLSHVPWASSHPVCSHPPSSPQLLPHPSL